MKKFSQVIAEKASSTVVVSFGRMNPMTNGHEKLANKLKSEAASRSADAKLYLSHSTNPKKDPLPFDTKVKYAKKAFGSMVQNSAARTIIEVAKELTGKYSSLVVVVGSDRVPEFKTLLNKYNGKDFTFDSIEIVSAGERDPDAEGVEGMSGSKMRRFAEDEDFASFRKGVPSKLSDDDAKGLFDAVRKGMKLSEEVQLEEGEKVTADYKVSKSGRKYPAHRIVLGKKKEDDEEDDDNEEVKEDIVDEGLLDSAKTHLKNKIASTKASIQSNLTHDAMKKRAKKSLKAAAHIMAHGAVNAITHKNHLLHAAAKPLRKAIDKKLKEDVSSENMEEAVLGYSQRMARASRFKRMQKRVQRARMLAMRKYASPEKLKQRSLKMARQFFRSHLAGGKDYSMMSTGEKMTVDSRLQKFLPSIKKLAARLMPTVRSKEVTRHARSMRGESVEPLSELAYQGNIGAMEMFAFFQKATPEQKAQLKSLIAAGKDREAWKMIHKVTGVKLVGPQFEQYEDDEQEGDEVEVDGIEMAQVELSALIEDARSLIRILNTMEEEPEAWVQSKISLATDYLSTVRDYLDFSDEEEEDDEEEDDEDYSEYEDDVYAAAASMEPSDYTEEVKHVFEDISTLTKKAEKSGIPFKYIKEVFDRGCAEYIHRPGFTRSQWAYARVNSFISGGATTKGADADLWESTQKNLEFSKFVSEAALEYGTDAARMAYARATPGQSQEIIQARYSADKALEAINNANLQRAFKLYSEEACCDECQDEIVEEVDWDLVLHEADYQGKDVKLNKPFYTPDGPKKSAVYTMGPNGKVVIVRFGDPNMEIKKDNPERRASFRARHNCDDPGPKWKARYWSCRAW